MLSAWVAWVAIAGTGTPAQSAQAAFDAASAAATAGRCEEAVKAFDELAKGPAAAKSPIVSAAIAVRRGNCLLRLNRDEEGEAALRRGTPVLAKSPGNFAAEARNAYLTLSNMAAGRFDYAAAIADARAALDLSEGPARISPLYHLAIFSRFDGDGTAAAHTSEALRLVEGKPDATKPELAVARMFHGRALMAADRVEEARKVLGQALSDAGGLGSRVDLSDVAIRYDLAQASLMLGKRDEARRYLAYTGAGRISEAPFERAEIMQAPECGEVPGMTPDAYAIVEFSLGDDGAIERVEPIYAKGGRDTALAFARAVKGRSWSPETAKTIPAFYRKMTRVEIRCTRSGARTDIMGPLDQQVAAWFEEKKLSSTPMDVAAASYLPTLRSAAAGSDLAALQANLTLADSEIIPNAERLAAAKRASAIAGSTNVPQAVSTRIALATLEAEGGRRPRSIRRGGETSDTPPESAPFWRMRRS